jgi:hypothetical protein
MRKNGNIHELVKKIFRNFWYGLTSRRGFDTEVHVTETLCEIHNTVQGKERDGGGGASGPAVRKRKAYFDCRVTVASSRKASAMDLIIGGIDKLW